MIKIEFKEAQLCRDLFGDILVKDYYTRMYTLNYAHNRKTTSVTFGCPSELVPSRSEVLAQLGITKEQDEANQIEWQCK